MTVTLNQPPQPELGHVPRRPSKTGDHLSANMAGCSALLNDLLETDPADIGRTDVALLNLL